MVAQHYRQNRKEQWILVADGDDKAAARLADYFSEVGFQTCHTDRGEEALSLACSRNFLVAIVDVVLRDTAGSKLVSRLREIDPTLPVIMTSADYRPELEVEARRAGILHYAHKPTDYRVLAGIVKKLLEG
jgi:DNA-binding response OmpR family regulator